MKQKEPPVPTWFIKQIKGKTIVPIMMALPKKVTRILRFTAMLTTPHITHFFVLSHLVYFIHKGTRSIPLLFSFVMFGFELMYFVCTAKYIVCQF